MFAVDLHNSLEMLFNNFIPMKSRRPQGRSRDVRKRTNEVLKDIALIIVCRMSGVTVTMKCRSSMEPLGPLGALVVVKIALAIIYKQCNSCHIH